MIVICVIREKRNIQQLRDIFIIQYLYANQFIFAISTKQIPYHIQFQPNSSCVYKIYMVHLTLSTILTQQYVTTIFCQYIFKILKMEL